MVLFTQTITGAQVLDALVDDSTRFSGADIAPPKRLGQLTFWSATSTQCVISSVAGNKALPDVDIPNLTGLTILHAEALLAYDCVLNADGANPNELTGVTYIQVNKAAAGLINAIYTVTGQWHLAAGQIYSGGLLRGGIDISSRVAFNAATNFQWTVAESVQDNLELQHVRTGVVITVE